MSIHASVDVMVPWGLAYRHTATVTDADTHVTYTHKHTHVRANAYVVNCLSKYVILMNISLRINPPETLRTNMKITDFRVPRVFL